jgi:putative transposase
MSRYPRIEVPGGYYHVVSRGNNKQPIFDEALRRVFISHLDHTVRTFGWTVYAYALMTNHYHLVFQIGDCGLSDGMHRLNLGFARASNARFDRINHCVGRTYWSTLLETDAHLYSSLRYTLWNPARAGVGAHPADTPWASFRASIGLDWPPECLAVQKLLAHFGNTPDKGRDALRRFIWAGRERCRLPWQGGRGILT